MKNAIRFVFVLFQPTEEERRRAWDVVVDNTQNNRGYGAGANIGIKEALDKGAEWVVICNQDIVLTKKDIGKLKKTLHDSNPRIVGPEAGSFDKKRWSTKLTAGGSIDYISGSCMAIHKKVIEKIGYFYEPYFLYYEDADFSVLAKKAGFPLRHVALSGYKHDHNSASGRMKEYYLARNHLLFVLRNAPWSVKLYELLRLPKTLLEYITL